MRLMGFACLLVSALTAQTQLRSLRGIPVPEPANLSDYVRDKKALVALGKAFFWDMQAGSDGVTACATCHFHAGADHRPRHSTVDPNAAFALNRELASFEFPFRLLADPFNKNSAVLRDSGLRVGSAGTFRRIFEGIVPGQAAELGRDEFDKPEFLLGELSTRRVTLRNTPSVYNTAYYARGFWDGRAERRFNGLTVTGLASDSPGVLVAGEGGFTRREPVSLDFSSLASQGVGPILDHLEMSYAGRTWAALGKKMLSLPPLARQRVARTDSVLGEWAAAEGPGLVETVSYARFIQDAFLPRFWESAERLRENGDPDPEGEYSQMELNFPLFWGLALQAYQATLNSDDSPFDRFAAGETAALTAQQQEGLRLFQGAANCDECHNGPEFSAAAFNVNRTTRNHAFDRTGVRPASEDAGTGNGSFKSISLRNVEFTGPYFHNGGTATLEQVVDFYRRGGDFSPVANDLRPLNLTSSQAAALVAFLKALSDDRVRYERAPFDHPELCVPVGHEEKEPGVLAAGDSSRFPRSAAERWRLVPATGAEGNAAPLRTFEELLAGVGANGERAHALGEPCTVPVQ